MSSSADLGGAAAEAAGGGYVDLGAAGLLDRGEEGFEALEWRLLVDESCDQTGAGVVGPGDAAPGRR